MIRRVVPLGRTGGPSEGPAGGPKMSRAANCWLLGWTITSFLMCIVVCLVIAVCLTYVMDFILTFVDVQLMKPVMWMFMGFHMFVGLCFLFLILISNSCCRKGRCYKTCCCFHILSVIFAHFLHLLWIIFIIVMLLPALLLVGVHFACVYVPTCISITDFGLQADLFEQYNIEGVLAAINNFNTSSLYGIAEKFEKMFVKYLDEAEDSKWLDSLLTTVENSEVAKLNSSTLFKEIDKATEFVFDKFDYIEENVDIFATLFNHTVHEKADTLLGYINESLEMLDNNVLDSDLLFRIYNTSYKGHIEDVAAYIDDITGEKLDELEQLLEKKNISIPGTIGSLSINRLLELPQLVNISIPKNILESLPDSSRLDVLLQLLKTNVSLSENALAALPESTQLDVLLELLKKNVSLPEESISSFSKLPSLEVVMNLLRKNVSLPSDAFDSLPQYARQDVLMHILRSNLTLPDNAFVSLGETARMDVLLNMLRSNLTLPPDALASFPKSPKLDVLVKILSNNVSLDSLPDDILASVPENARLDVLLHLARKNITFPHDPLPSLSSAAQITLLKHFLWSNVSIPDDALAALPESNQEEILFLLLKNNIRLSDEQLESLHDLRPETVNLTVPELHLTSRNFAFQNENKTTLLVLELLRNGSDDFVNDLSTLDLKKYADDKLKDLRKSPDPGPLNFTLPSELDDMIIEGSDAEDMVNITKAQKEQIMGKLRMMANEAAVMALLASEEARRAMKAAVEAGKKVLDSVDENSRMLAQLAKEKATQAAVKAKAAARWALSKARQGILKVKEIGFALARGAWDVIHDLALNCRRYASAAFDFARLAVREARKSVKYVVQLADRALVYFRKGYAYVRNFCRQMGLRKRAVGVYCAEAKDVYCEKIEGSAIRLIIVFLMSIFLNITLVNYLISLSASVMAISYTRKKRKRRKKVYTAPVKGSLFDQMTETGSYTMLTNM